MDLEKLENFFQIECTKKQRFKYLKQNFKITQIYRIKYFVKIMIGHYDTFIKIEYLGSHMGVAFGLYFIKWGYSYFKKNES